MPYGDSGTSHHASSAMTGTAMNITAWLTAKARPRIRLGTSSVMYASMVMTSTPMPIPAMNRHSSTPADVVWQAMITDAAV
jgi:hypothetical protein